MILKRISILNYKNLEQVEIGFSAKLNCFFGQTGMGKRCTVVQIMCMTMKKSILVCSLKKILLLRWVL